MKVKKLVASNRTWRTSRANSRTKWAVRSRSMAMMARAGRRSIWSQKRWLVSCSGRKSRSRRRAVRLVPGGDLHLAARIEAAIEGGDQQVVSDAGSAGPASGGDVAVDVLDQAQASGQVVQGDDGAELGDDRLLGRGGEGSRGSSQSGDDVVGAAEILLPDDLGLAVDAAAFACVVVRSSHGWSS